MLSSNRQRNISPRYYKSHLNYIKNSLSPSPIRKFDNKMKSEEYLRRELKNYYKKEKKYLIRKNDLVQEHNVLKKQLFRSQSKNESDSARIESEREDLFMLLIDLISSGKVSLEIPNNYNPSVKTNVSNINSRYNIDGNEDESN